MEKTAGIIAEYNPFHNGHAWQLSQIKKKLGDVPVIAVMSGHFTQRGEAAIADKWLRAEMAVKGGVDLALELPFVFACRSAEYFAGGAAFILSAAGVVTHLCFGVETDDTDALHKMARESLREYFPVLIKDKMRGGCTYARAISDIFSENLGVPEDISRGANNILAVEYLKALERSYSRLLPLAIKRSGAGHLDAKIISAIASATAIRAELQKNGFTGAVLRTLPASSACLLLAAYSDKKLLLDENALETLAFYRLYQLTPEEIRALCDVSEGLEYRFKKAAALATSLTEFRNKALSRRYPLTRLNRALLQLLIAPKGSLAIKNPPYARILSFNGRGRRLIKKIRSLSAFPLIDNLPAYWDDSNTGGEAKLCLAADIQATYVYQLLLGANKTGLDFIKRPVYVT